RPVVDVAPRHQLDITRATARAPRRRTPLATDPERTGVPHVPRANADAAPGRRAMTVVAWNRCHRRDRRPFPAASAADVTVDRRSSEVPMLNIATTRILHAPALTDAPKLPRPWVCPLPKLDGVAPRVLSQSEGAPHS